MMSLLTLLDTPRFWLLLSVGSLILLWLLGKILPRHSKPWANLLRWLLVPYLGLLAGGLSPRLLGLTNLDWQVSLSLGVAILMAVLIGLLLVRLTTTLSPSPPAHKLGEASLSAPLPSVAWPLVRLLYSGAEEFHWCFLRGALWEFFFTLPVPPEQAAYWSIVSGTLYAGLELWLSEASAKHKLLKTVVLIATSVLFFYTRNFWLGWLLHSLSWLILV
jgi:hypothetical protein